MAEELWQKLGHKETISYEPWPQYDEAKLISDEVEVVVQINGKVRSKLIVSREASKEELEKAAKNDEKIKALIEGKTIRKVIAVPGKLVNIVAN